MSQTNRNPLIDRVAVGLGTGLGIGFIPVAPGTFGSFLGPPFVWATLQSGIPITATATLAVAFITAGIPICERASQALGKHDPGSVVYDEIAAFWLVYLPHIILKWPIDWISAVAGFVLFRFFDISKPWPVSRLEKLPGGLGIMADDLAAGLMAAACLLALKQIV